MPYNPRTWVDNLTQTLAAVGHTPLRDQPDMALLMPT